MQVDQYIHRILVEEDAKNSQESVNELFHAAADAGENVYKKGDFAASKVSNLDVYLLKKVIRKIFVSKMENQNHDENCQCEWFVFRLACFQTS